MARRGSDEGSVLVLGRRRARAIRLDARRVAHLGGELAELAAQHEHHFGRARAGRNVDLRIDEKPLPGLLGNGGQKNLDGLARSKIGGQVQFCGSDIVGRLGFDTAIGEAEAGKQIVFRIACHQRYPSRAWCCQHRKREQQGKKDHPENPSSHHSSKTPRGRNWLVRRLRGASLKRKGEEGTRAAPLQVLNSDRVLPPWSAKGPKLQNFTRSISSGSTSSRRRS